MVGNSARMQSTSLGLRDSQLSEFGIDTKLIGDAAKIVEIVIDVRPLRLRVCLKLVS